MVVALALVLGGLASVAASSSAAPAPPPGELAGTGNLAGTESFQDETFLGIPCFQVNKSIFAVRGTGTFHGRTAGGPTVIYRAEISEGQTLYGDGPLRVEVENTQNYYHGPSGTHGTTGSTCDAASAGGPVPAEFRIFAPGNVYRLDASNNQVPCSGQGTFSRYGYDWNATWSLSADCTVVGNSAGASGAGLARAGTNMTHTGRHTPCFNAPCVDNFQFDYAQYLPYPGFRAQLGGPTSANIGETVTLSAAVTNDGLAVANVPVSFSVTGPAPPAPPGGAAVTGADGRASFTFSAAAAGDYSVSATATNAIQTHTATHTVAFRPVPPPTMTVAGPSRSQTEEAVTVTAAYTNAGRPVPGATIDFAVAGPGPATPASGSAVTNGAGSVLFTFSAARSGDYTVTASNSLPGQGASAAHHMHLEINTFKVAGGLDLLADDGPSGTVIDPAGRYAYFGSGTSDRVVKVDLATFERVGALALNSNERGLSSAVIDPAGRYAYFGTGAPTGRATVIKINLESFSRVGAITLEEGEQELLAAVIDPAGRYAYFGTGNLQTTAMVVKIDLETFTRVGAITFEPGEIAARTAVMDPAGRYAYFGARGEGQTPGRVVKVDLERFERVGVVVFGSDDKSNPSSAVIDPAGRYAYFATSSSVNARLVKVDLGTFRRVGAIVMDQMESPLNSAVMDPAGRYAYFGVGGCPACSLIKVDLVTFSRAHAIPVGRAGELNRSAVIDPAGNFAYFGQWGTGNGTTTPTLPSRIVKVALNRPPNPALAVAPDAYATDYLTPLSVPAPGVLANDGPGLAAGQASDPAGGSVVLNPDGSFTYTPNEAFSGTDTFTYTASDGTDYSAPATVSIKVGAAPEGVRGSAYGHFSEVSLFGGPSETRGPGPTVSLAIDASNSPQNARVESAQAQYGPALIFQSGPIDVHAEGATGPTGYATTSADVRGHPDRDKRPGPFLYDGVASTCTANRTGTTASATITNGIVETSYYIRDDPNTPEVEEGGDVKTTQAVPPDPPAGYTVEGTLDHIGDRFRIVFNKQTANPDGSRTITGAHMELLGPTAVGEVLIARAECGVNLTPPTVGLPVADFDGNGASDVSVFRPADGTWYAQGSAALGYGAPGDIAVPADYDGDGKADVAVFRPSNGVWYIHGSAGADTALAYGASGDIPVPADYDGDGRADIAVFRPAQGAWYIHNSAGGDTALGFGTNGDIPVAADYDGDAKADIAVFRPSQGAWYVRNSAGGADTAVGYGANGDIPVAADYNGDGRADIAVFRPSEGVWYVQGGSASAWGVNGDVPVPGDYDGDAKADIAVFRPSQGVWYIHNSGGGDTAVGYGANGDVPAPLAPAIRMRFF